MYQAGQWVVYGIHGVCRVIGTEKQRIGGKRTEYLVLEPLAQNESRYYLPTANPAALAKLKDVLSAEELRALLVSPEIREDSWIEDEGRRKQYYKELVSGGDRVSILRMVVSLYRYREAQTAAGRKFHICDDNFLRDAEKLLTSEITLVLEMPQEQARDYLRETLKD